MSDLPLPPSAAAASGLLTALRSHGLLSALDYHFARTLATLGEESEETLACAALASRAVQLGHVCVDLYRAHEIQPLDRKEGAPLQIDWPAPEQLIRALERSPLCGKGQPATPLVLDARGRLYLHRYATYERSLARALRGRARPDQDVDVELLTRGITRLFPEPPAGARARDGRSGLSGVETHRVAACVAALHYLAVICGGPGTGKTTTVVKILALLQEQALQRARPPLRMLLLAPTGKAARRLASSVASGLARLDLSDEVRAALPSEASTIHRALGGSKARASGFWHDADNPLSADVVLVDEVSMVDLALLYRLLLAVRPQARLILQGDKDQLASVEAGAILGDIYDAEAAQHWSGAFAERVQRATGLTLPTGPAEPGLGDCLVSLDESYRYAHDSGIGRLARAINAGDAALALRILRGDAREPSSGESPDDTARDCQLFASRSREHLDGLDPAEDPLELQATAGYLPFIRASAPEQKLARLGDYRILCAHRQGPQGVLRLNQAVEAWLGNAGLIDPQATFYENRPIIITQNDYALGLFNGDVGVVVKDAEERLRVCFESAQGLRFLLPGRLPPHETVFATTIHKSQGSEFDSVSIVLPEAPSALVGRELLYTAVTRARLHVDVFARPEVIRSAIGRSVQRASGLHDTLWEE
jgi:exodeoxyribonuclease V alpha subunit